MGFDFGANAASTFVLVYNLFDTEDLFKRFGAGEGLRLGVNAGYMKFSHKQNWLPF